MDHLEETLSNRILRCQNGRETTNFKKKKKLRKQGSVLAYKISPKTGDAVLICTKIFIKRAYSETWNDFILRVAIQIIKTINIILSANTEILVIFTTQDWT